SWIKEVQTSDYDDIDSNVESDYEDDADDMMAVRRIEVEDLGVKNNKGKVKLHEIEPIEYEDLDGLAFSNWVNY
ncbi:12685_t:CDS:2, partial [Racocetra fulgida]